MGSVGDSARSGPIAGALEAVKDARIGAPTSKSVSDEDAGGVDATGEDPFGKFHDDTIRLEAIKFRERRLLIDTIGRHCVRLAAYITAGAVLIFTDHPAAIGSWFAVLIAMMRGGASPT